ncbi:pyridoxamine 5'-phosphate oxidase family protein [Micromonospora phaseoli]|uniref:Pyridoxamine 5'-phosphate oxidase family protein n=1 Tax=Micromonospora phaseoli TaxID=1144548 RepID=A0A1H7C6Z2_9ACTN|nr:PPOX class F420-dependent oxidoreductase [Micromonospora phaseoli]PZV92728.1 pyridoxamine 5'-phosphate oxidase family protein [Micromonospora phaseoli]GIJ76618.1 PPOX class F420-dependent oxidoreductase [Micromonospora phaseoli]SEJ82812.1 pyridoxamine 5'-phosphate oxidase family protein [Micromonospora phaseoli]
MATLSERELEYLGTQRLGRLATVAPDGYPQNNPVGFFYNADLGTIDIGGHKLGDSRKFGNVRAHPKATLVVDDIASVQPWHVRGVEIRGDVEALVDVEPPMHGMSREVIRIYPARIRSWGLASD